MILGTFAGGQSPRTNYNQTDPSKADYLIGREDIENHINDKNNPHGVSAIQIGAAPASFGLGRQVTMSTEQTLTNANDGVLTGWYRIDSSTTNGVGVIAIMRVEAYSSNNVVQTAYLQNRSDYVTVKRRCCLSGAWKDWEDVTPSSFVPTSRTVNGKALSSNITLSASDVGAAPDDYGLGKNAGKLLTSAHDLNTVFAGGWYKWTGNSVPANVPPNCTYGVMVVNPYSNGVVVQKVYYLGNGKQLTPIIIRQIWGANGIGEWEWENPFMLVGEEYRTTEYHNGNPVYKKIDSGGVVWWSVDKSNWYREAERHGAAPDGYGLGIAASFSVANIDTITNTGWYYSNETTTIGGITSSIWWLFVKAYGNGANFATQELHIGNGTGITLVRHKTNGTWRAWKEVCYTGIKVLWTNASPNSTFNAQSVSVALSGYQWVAIRFKLGRDKDYVKTVFGAVGDTLVMDMITSGDYVGTRKAITSTSKVEFEAATYSANVDNKQQYFIPIAIYGIKGVD